MFKVLSAMSHGRWDRDPRVCLVTFSSAHSLLSLLRAAVLLLLRTRDFAYLVKPSAFEAASAFIWSSTGTLVYHPIPSRVPVKSPEAHRGRNRRGPNLS
jgi:hypothetical protein